MMWATAPMGRPHPLSPPSLRSEEGGGFLTLLNPKLFPNSLLYPTRIAGAVPRSLW